MVLFLGLETVEPAGKWRVLFLGLETVELMALNQVVSVLGLEVLAESGLRLGWVVDSLE